MECVLSELYLDEDAIDEDEDAIVENNSYTNCDRTKVTVCA